MTGRWALPAFTVGEIAPDFSAVTWVNPKYHFNTAAGRFLLIAFLPPAGPQRDAALAAFEPVRPLFDDTRLAAFFVAPEALGPQSPEDRLPGQRWFFDHDGEVRRLYHLSPGEGAWFLLDPAMRQIDSAPLDRPEPLFEQIRALPPLNDYAGRPLVAPVLVVPRVFDRDLCRRLVDYYDARGGALSGVMRDIDGKTVGLLDRMKSRRDVYIAEEDPLREETRRALVRNLAPMIRRAFQFNPTRLERYLVARYDADEGGYFMAHRDDETVGTAHRRFACSINLTDDFEGGDLRFPEFGRHTYRPPVGGAVVFCCNLQHEATPVVRGRRYAFLPFLYDEAGREIRERNRHAIDNSRATAETAD